MNAQPNSASRSSLGSGTPNSVVIRATVTVTRASASQPSPTSPSRYLPPVPAAGTRPAAVRASGGQSRRGQAEQVLAGSRPAYGRRICLRYVATPSRCMSSRRDPHTMHDVDGGSALPAVLAHAARSAQARFAAVISRPISVGPLTISPLAIRPPICDSGTHSTRSASLRSTGSPTCSAAWPWNM